MNRAIVRLTLSILAGLAWWAIVASVVHPEFQTLSDWATIDDFDALNSSLFFGALLPVDWIAFLSAFAGAWIFSKRLPAGGEGPCVQD